MTPWDELIIKLGKKEGNVESLGYNNDSLPSSAKHVKGSPSKHSHYHQDTHKPIILYPKSGLQQTHPRLYSLTAFVFCQYLLAKE